MCGTNWTDLRRCSIVADLPLPENRVFSDIVKEVFGDIRQYETDVPEDFERPCFLFINPDKSVQTEELTKAMYKETRTYEIYMFCTEGDVTGLTINKDKFVSYLMGTKKVPIPDTERYFTIEQVVADTNDTDFVVAFMIRVSRVRSRDLRRPKADKIRQVVNKITLDREEVLNE